MMASSVPHIPSGNLFCLTSPLCQPSPMWVHDVYLDSHGFKISTFVRSLVRSFFQSLKFFSLLSSLSLFRRRSLRPSSWASLWRWRKRRCRWDPSPLSGSIWGSWSVRVWILACGGYNQLQLVQSACRPKIIIWKWFQNGRNLMIKIFQAMI